MKLKELANRNNNSSSVIVDCGQNTHKAALLAGIIPEKNALKHKQCLCHIHDLEFYDVTYNCIGIHVRDLVRDESLSFRAMLRALYRGIVTLTNDQSGGIGFINFDREAASFLKDESHDELVEMLREFFLDLNIGTRKGCEKAYVTFNFGLDSTDKGRRIGFAMLDAFDLGRADGSPFIFPNLVFKLHRGCNLEASTPNHDLYQRALSVTAKRMIPTYWNCDSKSNCSFDPEIIGIMGCRSRVATNVNGNEGAFNRGNVTCVTLNLVQMAYMAKGGLERFYRLLDENLSDARDLLLHHFELLAGLNATWESYRNGYYLGAKTNSVRKMLQNGTLSIGFIGLWDALRVLDGKSYETEADLREAFPRAYGIVEHMRNFTDEATRVFRMNFSLLASAAEGVTGRFAQYDSEHEGKGNPISEKGFYSNSFHVPVDVPVDFMTKAELEGPFHKLCNGGAITYIEAKEMPNKNVAAVQEVIEYACSNDCNYVGMNFPLDYCEDCGFTGRMADTCPHCGSKNVKHLRRVSGYLAEEATFATGKKKEMRHRTAHLG